MAIPTAVNNQITDAIEQAYNAGGDEAISVVAELMQQIAEGLAEAKKGETTIEDLSVAFENAEVSLHVIVAQLATGKE